MISYVARLARTPCWWMPLSWANALEPTTALFGWTPYPVVIETSRDGDHLRVDVTDRGNGIPPEDATHIFELFGQGAHGAAAGGLGIGLHLVKRITELHGGHVGMNSRVGEGSTFWVRLPLPIAEPEEGMEAAQEAA